jgi:hypothetical protein
MHYNARLYDPALGRFVSADTIVPGSASGSMQSIAAKPLTVAFHETGFLGKLNQESNARFWFQLGDQQRQQLGSPFGPVNPQALNRYSYVQNNPVKYTDPSGHSAYLSAAETAMGVNDIDDLADQIDDFVRGFGLGGMVSGISVTQLLDFLEGLASPSFLGNVIRLALIQGLKTLIKSAGPAATIGVILLAQITGDLRTLTRKIRDMSVGGKGVGIAVSGNQILLVDRGNGNSDVWTPDGINGAFRRGLLISNMPSSWELGAKPVGDPNWYRDYHFAADSRWIPHLDDVT